MTRRVFAGIGSLLVLLVVIVGIPVVLVFVAGNPLPTPTQWNAILSLQPDYGNEILLSKFLPCLAWVAWALFAGPWLYELVTRGSGHVSRRSWLVFRGQQRIAAVLIGAVLVMFASGTFLGSAQPADAAPQPAQHAAAQQFSSAFLTAAVTPASSTPTTAPAPPPPAPVTQLETVQHTVAVGENLWVIAEQYYGDGSREGEIFAASTGTVQADGRQLVNPSLIRPGWVLTVPNVEVTETPAAPVTPAPVLPAAPAADSTTSSGSSTNSHASTDHAATPAAGGVVASTLAPSASSNTATSPVQPLATSGAQHLAQSPDSDLDLSIPLLTAGGVSGLLAAGLLVALGRRRAKQRRRRLPGERIAMPEPEAATLELELRMVENPLGLDDIDNALRTLQIWAEDTGAALPELLAVRLVADELSLYLLAPAELPEPFEQASEDRTAWVVRPGQAKPPIRASVSPYPALATIGIDDQGGVLMLDLEQLGALNVIGDETTAQGILNAIAVELAENPWSDQIQVTLVGMPTGLAHDLNRFRAQHVDDVAALVRNLQNDLRDRAAALASYDVDDVHTARARATDAEAWAPHIVILGEMPTDDLREQLVELVDRIPRLGLAMIAHGMVSGTGSVVRIESPESAVLILPGEGIPPLPFRPQVLQGRELELIQQLFATTDQEATPAPVSEPSFESAAAVESAPHQVVETPPVQTTDLGPVGPATVEEPPAEISEPAAELEQLDVAPDWPAPYLRFLGPIDALHLADTEGMPGRSTELIAYLLLQPGMVEGKQLQQAFWPDTPNAANNQRGLAKKVRVALGHAPDGSLLLPENVNHQGYTLHPAIRSDWDDFRALIGPDLSRATNENLIAAIRLVRGTPFAGCDTRRWWQWISIPQEDMIASIMDAAEELGRRALVSRNTEQLHFAAHVEQAVEPLNEAGWRIQMHAAMQAGNMDEFFTILDDLYARVGGDDPEYELDQETQHLVDQAQR